MPIFHIFLDQQVKVRNIFIYKTNLSIFLVVGHRSNLVFGTLNGVYVICMQGRFHPYEGYTTATVNKN
jgi:purine nucleoside phosphorylase